MAPIKTLFGKPITQLQREHPSLHRDHPQFFEQAADAAAKTREIQRQWRLAHPYPKLSSLRRGTAMELFLRHHPELATPEDAPPTTLPESPVLVGAGKADDDV